MAATLTLNQLFKSEIESIAPNSNDHQLFRIYLGAGRFQTQALPIQLRNEHPEWWANHTGLKSYLDQHKISDYFENNNQDALTEFLATIAVTFGIADGADQMKLAEGFYEAVSRSHADTIAIEEMMRFEHETLH